MPCPQHSSCGLLSGASIPESLRTDGLPRRPAQFAEETKKADRVVPQGIIWSVIATAFLGMSYILVLLYCVQVGLSTGMATCPCMANTGHCWIPLIHVVSAKALSHVLVLCKMQLIKQSMPAPLTRHQLFEFWCQLLPSDAAAHAQDTDSVLTGVAQGYPIGQIFYDVFMVRLPTRLFAGPCAAAVPGIMCCITLTLCMGMTCNFSCTVHCVLLGALHTVENGTEGRACAHLRRRALAAQWAASRS